MPMGPRNSGTAGPVHSGPCDVYSQPYANHTIQIHMPLHCSGTNAFINFWVQFFDTRREKILNSLLYHTMLTIPKRSVHLVVQSQFLKVKVGYQLHNIIDGPNFWQCLSQWQTTQLSAHIVQSQLLTTSFSKSSDSQDHRFRVWRHSHSSHFLSGVYYDNCDCHILCARA